jgi:hypothetical protein
MSVNIFKNLEHQQLFDKQGFIVLPFLNEDEIADLNNYFDEQHPNANSSGFFSGSYSNDFEYKKNCSDKIVAVFTRAYEKYFTNYKAFGGAFLYKTPGQNSELAAHQDWTIVDENEYVALNCWVPLCDISAENGPIMIMPGSQATKHFVLRAPTLPFFFSGNDDVVMDELEPMLVKAGSAVILNQSVIHYSPPNISDKIRVAITAGVKSKDAVMNFHFKLPDKDLLEVFEMEDDFLISFENFFEDIQSRPKMGKSVGFKEYVLPQYSKNELELKIEEMKKNAGFEPKKIRTIETVNVNSSTTKEKDFFTRIKLLFKR